MPDLVVAGAGMAGLVAAAQARQRGADVVVHEKLDRPGGSMRLSSGMVWRHREFARFRAECKRGDERLQRILFERLDGDLDWLESLGARVLERDTENPITTGVRFDTASLLGALLSAAGAPRLRDPLLRLPERPPVVLATGGFPASAELVRRHVTTEARHLLLRSARGGTGDGMRLAVAAGGRASIGLDEIYGRNMPAPPATVGESDFVSLAQLYARFAEVVNERGERFETVTWSEVDVAQWTARQPRARAWLRVPRSAMRERVRGRSVGEMVDAAATAGAPIRRDGGGAVVETVAGITRTLGGVSVDSSARAAPGVFAAGDDAGGIAGGGYASGLAAALVFGRIAADAALASPPDPR